MTRVLSNVPWCFKEKKDIKMNHLTHQKEKNFLLHSADLDDMIGLRI